MAKISFRNTNNPAIDMSAVINYPEGLDNSKSNPAVIVSHPGGGVKEQTAGTYAKKPAEEGFVTIAFDRSYQGESTGEPRQTENPHVSTEDVSAVLDHLTTLDFVDNNRIGAMGICAGAGYTAGSKWMSDDLFERAASKDKQFHVVEGANHMQLYEGESQVTEAVSQPAPFFNDKLGA